MTWEDELIPLTQAETALQQLPLHFRQNHAFVRGREAFHFHDCTVRPLALINELSFRYAAQRQAAQFGLVAA